MSDNFMWIDMYQELADVLVAWQDRQDELINFLEELRGQGLTISSLQDKNRDGERFLLKEIDPFTFFGVFNRQIRDEQRTVILTKIKQFFGLKSGIPVGFLGVPVLNNQKSWLFSYFVNRTVDDVPRLWRVFRLALEYGALQNRKFMQAFDDAQAVRNVNVNLTMGLFWIRPYDFLSLDGNNRRYLSVDLPAGGLTARFYVDYLRLASETNKSFPEISLQAWKAAKEFSNQGSKANPQKSQIEGLTSYWLVGAYWDDKEPQDQSKRFLDEGIWENGYEHKFSDDVKAMKVGDKIAIKAAFTQRKNLPFDSQGKTVSRMDIKAIGTVVANRGDGKTVEVEWDPDFEIRTWYFYTARTTVWKLQTSKNYKLHDLSRRLVDFIWNGKEQDYQFFCDKWWGAEKQSLLDLTADTLGDVEISKIRTSAYGVDDIVAAGVFVSETQLETVLGRLRVKKSLILQGPPGVGKTFIARKLAYALMEEVAPDRLEMVQFHQSYSYDDFVRGYRPVEGEPGTFGLQDGVFLNFCHRAAENPDDKYVFIIDEINRGNLSLIFGELLMLIEADKRGDEFAVPLVYRRADEPRFFIPSNLYLVGLMNVADRSLAIVDYALRRRFSYFDLSPQFDSPKFRQWLVDRSMPQPMIDLIVERMNALNDQISMDSLLGENYRVGHSYFCPKGDDFSTFDRTWFDAIVKTEIGPLLKEYWFDNPSKANEAIVKLLA